MKRIFNYGRLAGFPIGLGLTSVLVGGALNRVMIVELGLPVALVGFFFAVPLLVSPLRVWLGYRSDAHPIFGLRREPYIISGTLLAGVGVLLAAWLALRGGAFTLPALAAIVWGFLLYGFGKNLASNSFEALQADLFTSAQRPRVVTSLRVAMFAGIIGGAIALGRLLEPFSAPKLLTIAAGVAAAWFVLAMLTAWAQEKRDAAVETAVAEARQIPFMHTFRRYVWEDPQVRRFFFVLLLSIVGTLAQDVLLEPYGGLVLGMSVSETTRLTAIWGVGTVLSMMAAGLWLIKRYGYRLALNVGLVWCMVTFAGLIVAGMMGSAVLFMALIFLLGMGTGLANAGTLMGAIEFTSRAHAGILMGVWGLAVQIGQALGSLLGGGVVDVMLRLTNNNALIGYGTVFAIESLLLLAALILFRRVDLTHALIFQTNADEQLRVSIATD